MSDATPTERIKYIGGLLSVSYRDHELDLSAIARGLLPYAKLGAMVVELPTDRYGKSILWGAAFRDEDGVFIRQEAVEELAAAAEKVNADDEEPSGLTGEGFEDAESFDEDRRW